LRTYPVLTIALAQLFGTSLWFSANSAADDLMAAWGATEADIGFLTNAVQLGFIVGTLCFAVSGLADRYPARSIFALCSLLGALFNACFAWLSTGTDSGALFRLLVGFCLAGIYPLGMKLIVTWAPERAGMALAQLVGMLTLGTALPHATRLLGADWPWQTVILTSSVLAVIAAGLVYRLGDGPHFSRPQHALTLRLGKVFTAFASRDFRAAAFGYFGHMWELYAFWTLVPMLVTRTLIDKGTGMGSVSGLSFVIIGVGAIGCLLGGVWSRTIGSARVAAVALTLSGLCCLVFPIAGTGLPSWSLFILMLLWGAAVVADSPQFSALSAKACPPQLVGSALAIQNCIGFAITIIAIAVSTALVDTLGLKITWLLLPGPVLGLIGLYPLWKTRGPNADLAPIGRRRGRDRTSLP
jgi:MFS family permease